LTAAGSHKGAKVVELLNSFAQMSADATYGAYATAFNAKVDAALALSQTTDNAGGTFAAAGVATDKTFSLTTDADDISGTSAADTFVAATAGRLQDNDLIDGGAGNDTLNAKLNSTTAHDATINSIETLNFEVLATAAIDGANITGEKTVNVTGEAVLTYASGVAGTAYSVGGTAGLTLTQTGTDSTADAVTVTLKSGTVGALTLGDTAGVDFETINLVVDGATTASLTEAGTPTFADTGDSVVVTGTGDLVLSIAHANLGANATAGSQTSATINASGHTGKLTLDIGTDNTVDNISAEKWTGVDAIKIKTGSSDTDVITKVASGTEVIVNDQEAVNNTLTVSPNGTATNDELTITLNHKTAGSEIDLTGLVVDGFENFTLNSTGTNSASTVVSNVIDDIAGTTTDTKLTVSGDKKLTATGIESTFTNITVTNTAGSDLTVDAGGALTFTGGAAADRLELDTIADLTSADTLVGGDGRDTLAFSATADSATISSTQKARVSGFEILEFAGAQDLTSGDAAQTIDVTTFSGIDTVKFAGALTTDSVDTLTIAANDGVKIVFGDAVEIGTTYVDIQIANSANAGTNNTVTVALEKESAGAALSVDGWTVDNVENQIIEVKGVMATSDIITIDAIEGAQLQTLTVKSTAGVDATTGLAKVAETLAITAVETTLLNSFDASLATGAITFTDVSAYIATGATIKGGSAVDTLTAGVGADVMTGNAGNDILNGDTGNDSIDGGSGDDNINGDVGADTLTGGTGKDTFVSDYQESTEAAMDKITDFSALAADQSFDTLDLTGDTVTSLVVGSAISITSLTTETETGALVAYSTNGIIKLSGTESANVNTLAEWIDVAEALVANVDVTTGATAYQTLAFQYDGSTYVVQGKTVDAAGTETVTTGAVIQLVGVTGIAALSTTEAANTIKLA
jgi:hypothetical protein